MNEHAQWEIEYQAQQQAWQKAQQQKSDATPPWRMKTVSEEVWEEARKKMIPKASYRNLKQPLKATLGLTTAMASASTAKGATAETVHSESGIDWTMLVA